MTTMMKVVLSRQSLLHLLVLLAAFSFRLPVFCFQPTDYYNACLGLLFLFCFTYTHARNKCCFHSLCLVVVSNLWHWWQCHLQNYKCFGSDWWHWWQCLRK
jgi:hypothetical protein